MPEPLISSKLMTERVFDDSSSVYDRTGPKVFAQFGSRLVEHLPFGPDARVLDVATGRGAVLLAVARRLGPGGRATGIDLSAGMVQETERAAAAEGLVNVELHKMDAERLEFPDGTFDAVLCAHSLFLFPDQEAAVREMYRVTRPGGHVGLSVFGNTPPAFTPAWTVLAKQLDEYQAALPLPDPLPYHTAEGLAALLERCGFSDARAVSETSDIVYARGEEWWDFLLTMAARSPIMSVPEARQPEFREELLGKLRPMFSEDGLHLPVSMVYATARR
jgi:ubiquinone/menaquinone biosynthesis C-methylase UbiE